MFKEDNGNTSMMRVCFFIVVCCVMFVNVAVSIKTWTVAPLDIGAVTAILGMGFNKFLQKGKEANAQDANS